MEALIRYGRTGQDKKNFVEKSHLKGDGAMAGSLWTGWLKRFGVHGEGGATFEVFYECKELAEGEEVKQNLLKQ